MRHVHYSWLLTGLLVACSTTDKKDPLLDEAARYHQEATQLQGIVEPQIEQIDSLKTVLTTQRRPNATVTVATLDSLKTAFESWEENLVEVPGMAHDHAHGGKHDHHHHADATLKDLPAEQMRDLQRETLATLKQIQARLNEVVQSI